MSWFIRNDSGKMVSGHPGISLRLITHHFDLFRGELAKDFGLLVSSLLDVDQFVAVLRDGALHLAAVRGLLVELLSQPELDLRVLERGLAGQRVLPVLLGQLDHRTHRVTHLAGHQAHTCNRTQLSYIQTYLD